MALKLVVPDSLHSLDQDLEPVEIAPPHPPQDWFRDECSKWPADPPRKRESLLPRESSPRIPKLLQRETARAAHDALMAYTHCSARFPHGDGHDVACVERPNLGDADERRPDAGRAGRREFDRFGISHPLRVRVDHFERVPYFAN